MDHFALRGLIVLIKTAMLIRKGFKVTMLINFEWMTAYTLVCHDDDDNLQFGLPG